MRSCELRLASQRRLPVRRSASLTLARAPLMSQITVTLPDGSTRQIESGTPVLAVARDISPRLADAALAAKVDDRLVDLSYPLDRRRPRADRHQQVARGARPLPPLDGAPDGRRRHRALSRRAVRHRTGHRRGLLLRLRRRSAVRARGPRAHRSEDARAGGAGPASSSGRCGRATRRSTSSRTRGEPLKVQLIEEKTAGQSHVSCYTIKDRDTFVDFCVGPHVPSTNQLKAFKLLSTSNAYWKGDAKNEPMQRIYGTAFFSQKELDEHLTRLEEAKKRDHRKVGKELGLFTFHPWAPGRDVLAAQGHGALQHARQLHARRADPGRLRRGQGADHLQQGAVGDVRSLGLLPGQHVPGEVGRRRGDGPQADELPRPLPALRQRDAQLQGSAAALPRADAAAPQRSVGRALRPDARPPVLAGRWPLLRDAGADRRGSRGADRPDPARLRRLRPRATRPSSRRVPRSSSARSPRGTTPRRR